MDQDRVMAMIIRFQSQNEQVLGEITKKLDDIAKKAKEVAREADNAMKSFGAGASQIGDVFKQVAHVADSALKDIIKTVKHLSTSILDLAKDIVGNAVEGFKTLADVATKATLAVTAAITAFGTMGVKANIFREETLRALQAVSSNKAEAQDLFNWLDKFSEHVAFTTEQVQTLGKQLRTQFSADQVKEMIPVLLQAGHIMKDIPLDQIFRMIMMAKEGMVQVRETAALGFGRKELAGFGVDVDEDTGKISKGSKDQLVAAELSLLRSKYGTGADNENAFDVVITTLTSRFRKIARTATEAFYESFLGTIGKINDVLGNILDGKQGKQILEGLSSAFKVLAGVVGKATEKLPDFIKWLSSIINSENVVKVLGDIVGTFTFLSDEVASFFGVVSGGKSLGDIFETFADIAIKAISYVIRVWHGLVAVIEGLIRRKDQIWGEIRKGIDLVKEGFDMAVGAATILVGILAVDKIAAITAGILKLASAAKSIGLGIGGFLGIGGAGAGGAGTGAAVGVGAGIGVAGGSIIAGAALLGAGSAYVGITETMRVNDAQEFDRRMVDLRKKGQITAAEDDAIRHKWLYDHTAGKDSSVTSRFGNWMQGLIGNGAQPITPQQKAVLDNLSKRMDPSNLMHTDGVLQKLGKWTENQVMSGVAGSIPQGAKDFFNDMQGDYNRGFNSSDPYQEWQRKMAEGRAAIGKMLTPGGVPGKATNDMPPRLGAGGSAQSANLEESLKQLREDTKIRTEYDSSEVDRIKAEINDLDDETKKPQATRDLLIPALRQQQQTFFEQAQKFGADAKEYYELRDKSWKVEAQIVREQHQAIKEQRKNIVDVSSLILDTFTEQAKLEIDSAPDQDKSALEAARLIPILKARQDIIVAQAQQEGTTMKQWYEAQSKYMQIQGQMQNIAMKAMKDRQNQAREFVDAELGLAEAQLKNNPFLTERQKKEALIPFLAEKFRQAARPVFGESDIDKIRRFTNMENLKGDILKDAGLDLEHNAFKTIEGGMMTLFDRQRVGGIVNELDRIQRQETMRGPEPPAMIPPSNTAASIQMNFDTNLKDLPGIIANAVAQQMDEWVSQTFGGR